MTPELLNHRHCKNCERATPYDEELCSDECRDVWKKYQKKRARTVMLFYGGAVVMVLLLVNQLLKGLKG